MNLVFKGLFFKQPVRFLEFLLAFFMMADNTSALIMVGKGNSPVHDTGWPDGSLALANMTCRAGWWEGPPFGGGEWNFQYRGNSENFKEALRLFSAIRSPKLELVVHDGPGYCLFLADDHKTNNSARIDWSFTVWHPESWHRLFNNPKSVWNSDHPNFRQPVPPPRLDVYIGGGSIGWDKVMVPQFVSVRDERAGESHRKSETGALIQATVYDMASGKAVQGAHLIIANNNSQNRSSFEGGQPLSDVITDASGIASASVPAGNYQIWMEAPGYASRLLEQGNFQDKAFKQYNTELAKSVGISGKVSLMNGKPIQGVKITPNSILAIDGHGYRMPVKLQAISDQNGCFVLSGLPQGYVVIHAQLDGYYYGDILAIQDAPSTNLDLKMTSAGTIRVTVTDRSGKPMSQYQGNPIIVEVEPKGGNKVGSWGGSATIDTSASYTFTQVPPGEYQITSRPNPGSEAKKYAPTYQVTLAPGGQESVVIVYE